MGIMNGKGVPAGGPFYYFFLDRVDGAAPDRRSGEGV
jgi:hypothetical protein